MNTSQPLMGIKKNTMTRDQRARFRFLRITIGSKLCVTLYGFLSRFSTYNHEGQVVKLGRASDKCLQGGQDAAVERGSAKGYA